MKWEAKWAMRLYITANTVSISSSKNQFAEWDGKGQMWKMLEFIGWWSDYHQ